MSSIKGTNVLAPVVPFDTTDSHASHEARYGKGGYRSVADIAERDAIPQLRREAGMLVLTLSDGVTWRLGSNLTSWTDYSVTGPQGPAGPQGIPGAAGAAGPAGVAGAAGAKGDRGDAGPQGIPGVAGAAGVAGPVGPAGPAGAAGVAGAKGDRGDVGPQGPAGVAGAVGPAGPAGADGLPGAAGQQGPAGPQGIPGVAGAKGDTGERGPAGPAGEAGPQGIQGVAGVAGAAGATGATGAKGDRGDVGPAGPAGVAGQQGIQGPAGVAGATGPQGPAASLVYPSISDFPATGSSTALYLAEDTSRIYQWESPVYVEVGVSGGGAIHASTHATGGSDAITPASIGAAAASHVHSADAITSGVLPDARLSSSVVTTAALLSRLSMPTTAIETFPRMSVSFLVATNGNVLYSFFTPLTTLTVSQVTMLSGGTAAAGLTLARMGLVTYDEATATATLVAQTASDTSLFAATRTAYTRSFSTAGGFPATVTLTAGTRYGVALLCIGTTIPTIQGNNGLAEMSALAPRLSAIRTSQSDLSTGTATNAQSQVLYARFS
jgi:hypothetical protein